MFVCVIALASLHKPRFFKKSTTKNIHTLNLENLISDPENLVSNPQGNRKPLFYTVNRCFIQCAEELRRLSRTQKRTESNVLRPFKSSVVPLQDHCNFKEPSKHHMKSNINAEHEADQVASTVFQVFDA